MGSSLHHKGEPATQYRQSEHLASNPSDWSKGVEEIREAASDTEAGSGDKIRGLCDKLLETL